MTGAVASTTADIAQVARNCDLTCTSYTPDLFGTWQRGGVELLVRDDLYAGVQVYVRAEGREVRFTSGWDVAAVDAVIRVALAACAPS